MLFNYIFFSKLCLRYFFGGMSPPSLYLSDILTGEGFGISWVEESATATSGKQMDRKYREQK